jgi:hypothetical protein
MTRFLLTAALATVGFAGVANAAVTIVETTAKDPTTFDNNTPGQTSGTSVADGVGISFTTGPDSFIRSGNAAYPDPIPVKEPDGDSSNYLYGFGGASVSNPNTATVTFDTPVSGFYLYWGSIDGRSINDNLLTLDLAGGGTDLLTGVDLVALYPALKGNGTVSQWFWVSDTGGAIDGFTAGSYAVVPPGSPHAFEFDLTASPIPEPSTWAMMGLGFAGLGYAAFRRGGKSRPAIA